LIPHPARSSTCVPIRSGRTNCQPDIGPLCKQAPLPLELFQLRLRVSSFGEQLWAGSGERHQRFAPLSNWPESHFVALGEQAVEHYYPPRFAARRDRHRLRRAVVRRPWRTLLDDSAVWRYWVERRTALLGLTASQRTGWFHRQTMCLCPWSLTSSYSNSAPRRLHPPGEPKPLAG